MWESVATASKEDDSFFFIETVLFSQATNFVFAGDFSEFCVKQKRNDRHFFRFHSTFFHGKIARLRAKDKIIHAFVVKPRPRERKRVGYHARKANPAAEFADCGNKARR